MKKTLNAKNLEALGAERLAALLIEVSTGNAAIKRRLRLELAGAQSPKEVAREVRKRLAKIAGSRSFVDCQTRRALVDDLETQHRAILDTVAPEDPAEALDVMWRFTELAEPVFDRCDDSSGTVIGGFHSACADLAELAAAARPDPVALADQVFVAIQDNGYGQYNDLIALLAPALGSLGLEHLKARVEDLACTPIETPPEAERQKIGWRLPARFMPTRLPEADGTAPCGWSLDELGETHDIMHPARLAEILRPHLSARLAPPGAESGRA